ncbi:hypothetical protein [uncultured Hymenobacter sp.]|uniref:hypothetical protein n=1 Tax=uncultured Hymenobacter sp. TaxID=170016 RepID=UPI0035CA771A
MIEFFDFIFSKISRNIFSRIFILTSLAVTSLVAFLPTRFEENDDICMLLIASGSYGGAPEAHLVFINYIYGLGLKLLYSITAEIEWYTLVFLLLHTISLSIILFVIIKGKAAKYLKLVNILLFCILESQILLHLQFTTTAAIVSLAGIVLMLEKQGYRKGLGIAFCVIGSLIRLEVSFLVLFISFPFYIKEAIEASKASASIRLAIGYFSVCIMLIGSFEYVDQASYSHENGWKAYKEYNKLRGEINDNPNAKTLKSKLPPGIRSVDYALLMKFFQDSNVIDIESLSKINNAIAHISFTDKLKNVPASLTFYKKYLAFIGVALFILFINLYKASERIAIVLTVLAFMITIVFVSFIGVLKYRVMLSVLFPLLFVFYRTTNSLGYTYATKALVVVLSALCLYCASYSYEFYGQNNTLLNTITEQHKFIGRYLSVSANIVIPYAADYRTEGMPVFSVSKLHFQKRMFFSGWFNGIPLNNGFYTKHYDFVRGHSLFLRQESRDVIPLLIESIYINYGIQVKPIIAAESERYLIVEFAVI